MVTNVAEKPRTAGTGAYTLSRRPDSLPSPQVPLRGVSDLSQHTRPARRNPARSWSQAGGQGSDTADTDRTGIHGAGQGGPMQVDTGTLHGGGVWPFASQEDTPCLLPLPRRCSGMYGSETAPSPWAHQAVPSAAPLLGL